MKILIILVVICLMVITLAEKHSDNMRNALNECRREENISDVEYQKMIDHQFDNPSRVMKCFTACVSERIGILKDNILQQDVILNIAREVNKEQMTNIILEKCQNIKSEDRCNMAFRFHVCVQNTKAEILKKKS